MVRKTSLKDIAQRVGVSIPLVSYVLSNKGKENRVSEKTAAKIRQVAKELNYHPNLNARSLKTNKTRTIGVIVADISNPFFSNLARVIEDEAYSKDYTVIFGSFDENIKKFEKVLNFLQTRQVDGFIIAAPEGSKDLLLPLQGSQTPLVLIDRYFKDIDCAYVIVDNFRASRQATNYLIDAGHKKIAFIRYDSKLAHYQDRLDGYLDALNGAKGDYRTDLIGTVKHEFIRRDVKKAIKKFIQGDQIDAIYFQTNTLAEEGLNQLMKLDRALLNQVEVVAFDQNSAYRFLENPVPFIKQPIKKIGRRSVSLLVDQIEEKSLEEYQIRFETNLDFGRVKSKRT